MIDNKKIEEAIEDYVRYSSVEDEYPGTEGDAFKAGVEWAINEFLKDLWHPVSEEPKERKENIIVLQFEDEDDESNPLYASLAHERWDAFLWVEYCEDNGIYKWCYFKDLLPKKGGKQ